MILSMARAPYVLRRHSSFFGVVGLLVGTYGGAFRNLKRVFCAANARKGSALFVIKRNLEDRT